MPKFYIFGMGCAKISIFTNFDELLKTNIFNYVIRFNHLIPSEQFFFSVRPSVRRLTFVIQFIVCTTYA